MDGQNSRWIPFFPILTDSGVSESGEHEIPLPLGNGSILVKHAGHRPAPRERIFLQSILSEFESQAGLVGQWVLAVNHAHDRESEPFLPDLVAHLRNGLAAAFLNEEVGNRCVHVQRGQHSDWPLTGM